MGIGYLYVEETLKINEIQAAESLLPPARHNLLSILETNIKSQMSTVISHTITELTRIR